MANTPLIRKTGAQTVARALVLLEAVVRSEEPLGLADLQRLSGMNKSSVYRSMRELEEHGFVTREVSGHRYVVGGGLVALAAVVLRGVNVRSAARSVLVRVAEATSETVSLHVRRSQHRVCIDVLESDLPIRRSVPLGEMLPLFAGPSGKAILAFLPESEAAPVIELAREAGQDVEELHAQLAEVRELGYLARVGDRIPNVGGLSVPIFSTEGVIASLTVSGPGDRLSLASMQAAAPLVVRECAALSASLGGRE